MFLRNMSYRLRLPLSLVATALFTAGVVGVVTVWQTYGNVRLDLSENGARLGHALASATQSAIQHDDAWRAYTILRGPRGFHGDRTATLVLLDAAGKVFASNRPEQFPVALPLADSNPDLTAALHAYRATQRFGTLADNLDNLPGRLLLVTPVTIDGVPIGAELLQIYPREILWPRFASIVLQGGLSVLLVLAVIVPLGWVWGRKIIDPLTRLADCMARMRENLSDEVECTTMVALGDNEIGRLNAQFLELLAALREKAELERQMVASERLAAVGRLAAGVAHEINNPLGGMLVAIDTLRTHDSIDATVEQSLSLLERGLLQIQDTVSALLVEARGEPQRLAPQDIEDTLTLIAPHAENRGIRVEWDNRLSEPLPLPSTEVRQLVLNLLLNAVQCAFANGWVCAAFVPGPAGLAVQVGNDGEPMDQDTLDHLFEPYFSRRKGGSGLGLWVTYQIVRQLGGEIEVDSHSGRTQFLVRLPWQQSLEDKLRVA